ncbi:MAG: ester cyclase [Myxococcales bacterium]|nr:ester cyclase [Myxococcales bacterium]
MTNDDRAEIQDLLARYYTYVDTHDVERWVALWAADGQYDSGHVQARGTAELTAFLAGHVVHTRHLVTNVTVDVDGDRAIATNYMTVLPTAGKPDVIATAYCRSELRREAGRFRLVSHVYRPDPSFLPPSVGAVAEHSISSESPSETARNKQLVQLLTLELWGRRDESAIDRFFSEDYAQHSPFAAPGRAGVHAFFRAITAALPDVEVTLEHLYAEGDRVFAFMRWTGTHRGALFGAAPTGRAVTLRTAEVHRISNGRIVEHWDVVDGSAPASPSK